MTVDKLRTLGQSFAAQLAPAELTGSLQRYAFADPSDPSVVYVSGQPVVGTPVPASDTGAGSNIPVATLVSPVATATPVDQH